jgi:2-polyprenyl-6-hydroxyphenyl methylase/3-demethylubiquinone-9 3-methyltransferase
MILPDLQSDWPESWRLSHAYDLLEIDPRTKAVLGYTYAYRTRRDKALELLKNVCPPPARIIDIAAAQGNMSLHLAEQGYNVYWNDLRTELFDYAMLKYERGDINALPGNIIDLKIDQLFDCALATEVIEHTAHPDQFLASVARVVRPGGYVVLTTPNGAYMLNDLPKFSECNDPSAFEHRQFGPNSDDHIFLLHPAEIQSIAAAAGLRVCRLEEITNPLTNGHLKTELLLKTLPESAVQFIERLGRMTPEFIRRRTHTCLAVLLQKIP